MQATGSGQETGSLPLFIACVHMQEQKAINESRQKVTDELKSMNIKLIII